MNEWAWKETHGWKEKLLLMASREVLIKLVLQAILSYAMSVFLLPQQLCDDLLKAW